LNAINLVKIILESIFLLIFSLIFNTESIFFSCFSIDVWDNSHAWRLSI